MPAHAGTVWRVSVQPINQTPRVRWQVMVQATAVARNRSACVVACMQAERVRARVRWRRREGRSCPVPQEEQYGRSYGEASAREVQEQTYRVGWRQADGSVEKRRVLRGYEEKQTKWREWMRGGARVAATQPAHGRWRRGGERRQRSRRAARAAVCVPAAGAQRVFTA